VNGVSIRAFKKLNLPLVDYILKEGKRHAEQDMEIMQGYLFFEDEDTKWIKLDIYK
jgi:hypothetical protein